MATVGNIKIRIGGDITRLEKSLNRAQFKLERTGRRMAEMGSRLSTAITLPIIGIGVASLKTAGDFEALEKGMESMMGSAEAAKAEIALLRKEALKPGLNFEQALKGSVRLQAVQIDAELARRALAGFGNALALVGGTGEQLEGVTLALSQIAAKGKISAEEINQIAERVPQIRQILKDAFGTADTEELQKLGIGFEEFISKAIVELEKLPQAQSGIKNSIENTKLALQEAGAIIGKKVFPIFEKVANVVLKLANAFTRLPEGVQDNIIKFGLFAAAIGPVLSLMGSMKILAGTLVGSLARLIGTMSVLNVVNGNGIRVFKGLAASMVFLSNPMTKILPLMSSLLLRVRATTAGFKAMGKSMALAASNPIKTFQAGIRGIAVALTSITIPFGLIIGAIAAFGLAVVANIGPARKKFVELANTFIDLYNESTAFRGIVETISFAFKSLYSVGKSVLNGLFTGFKSLGKAVVALFKGDFDGIRSAILEGFDGLKNIGAKTGEEIGKAFNQSYKNTFEERPPIPLITEEDVDKSVTRISNMIKSIQDKLFGLGVPDEVISTAFADLSTKVFDRTPKSTSNKKGSSQSSKEDDTDFNQLVENQLFNRGEAQTLEPTNLLPTGLDEHIEKVNKVSESYTNLNEITNNLKDNLTPVQSAFVELGQVIGDNLSQGITSFKQFARSVLDSISKVIGGLIKKGVASAVSNALTSVPFPFNIAAGTAAGGLAAGLFRGLLNKITAPKLARGGLAFGETLATVGDNFNSKVDPEVIAPFSKLRGMLNSVFEDMVGRNGFQFDGALANNLGKFIQPANASNKIKLDGEFRISGFDLVTLINKAQQQGYRVNSL